ncbi:MAG: hypothetical protein JF606_27525 [Burkholderiales bacterium]|nr:hypothetical protein [Burkholderiales bacterium]
MFSFAVSLSQDNPGDSLGAFLLRYGSTDTDVSEPARNQVDAFIGNQAKKFPGQRLRVALDLLSTIPIDKRDEMCHQDRMTEADVSVKRRRWLLPQPERALLASLNDPQSRVLSQFSAALLRGGHGGVSEWLAMFNNGRDRLARQLLTLHMESREGGQGLAPVLDRLQEQADIPSARRLRIEGYSHTFVGEHRPSPATEMRQPAAAAEPAHGEMPPHETHEDNLELIDVFIALAEAVGLAERTIGDYRRALERFAMEILAKYPHADLHGFLQRYESSDEELKSRAITHRDEVIKHWPKGSQRTNLNAALNLLITVIPEERQLPQVSMRAQVRPSQLLTRLPQEDRQLLQQLRDGPEQRGPAKRRDRLAATLIRFGAELVKKRCGGLSEWLAMQGDHRHAEAKQLLEDHLAGITLAARVGLPSAIARLQRLAGTQSSDRIRRRADRAASLSNAGHAPDFPQAEAKAIDAAIAAKKGLLRERTLDHYRDQLIRFSTWLRHQRTDDRPAYPGGLQDILKIYRNGELLEVQRLRTQYLLQNGGANGSRKNLPAALKMLLDHHMGQALQESQPATPQPILSTNSLDLSNLPDLDGFDFPELDSLSSPQHSVEVQASHRPDLTQPMPASPAMSEANSEEMLQIFLAEVADVVAWQPAEALPAAPPTDDLITAMSRLREARRHRAPQSVATTADALGLDARQLAAYVTNDGNLHTNPLVQQWLLTLPRDELDALLRYQDNG